jgi:Ohr subfamily peroxiredoxin
MKTLYEAEATATGEGRSGHSRSSDGVLDVALAIPQELGGPGGATNPEQLFAAGYAACFHSALQTVARRDRIEPGASTVTARVRLGTTADRGFGLAVTLRVELPDVHRDVAQGLVDKAHQVCPYSNATRGNVEVALELA